MGNWHGKWTTWRIYQEIADRLKNAAHRFRFMTHPNVTELSLTYLIILMELIRAFQSPKSNMGGGETFKLMAFYKDMDGVKLKNSFFPYRMTNVLLDYILLTSFECSALCPIRVGKL